MAQQVTDEIADLYSKVGFLMQLLLSGQKKLFAAERKISKLKKEECVEIKRLSETILELQETNRRQKNSLEDAETKNFHLKKGLEYYTDTTEKLQKELKKVNGAKVNDQIETCLDEYRSNIELRNAVNTELSVGKRIQAIKAMRNLVSIGPDLKAAKFAVDQIQEQLELEQILF